LVFSRYVLNEEEKMRQGFRNDLMVLAIAAALGGAPATASAAGFALIEQSGSGMGNAFAGAAATAEDASTVFFNPAGMSRLQGSQFAVAGHVIGVQSSFNGRGTAPFVLGGATVTGTGDPGGTSMVPNAYFVMPIGDRMRFGIGVNVPFGLTTEYDDNWVGRFQGIKSELMTLNINPSFSYRFSDAVSIGAGINYQWANAELTNAVALAGEPGKVKLEADDDGWGWNFGVLFLAGRDTRIGFSYRSVIDYELEGNVAVTSDTGSGVSVALATAASGPAKADITFPDTFSLSVVQGISGRLELLGDVSLTRWSEINRVDVVNTTNGNLRDSLAFNFDDAWRISFGANYQYNNTWTLKTGVAYDQTPVKSETTRTVRLPDNDRIWLAFGGQRKMGRSGRIDLGYTHIFIKDADINFTRSQQAPGFTVPTSQPGTESNVTGSYEGSVDIVSIQYTRSF
jgi:long-chain fatty acid transport protein